MNLSKQMVNTGNEYEIKNVESLEEFRTKI